MAASGRAPHRKAFVACRPLRGRTHAAMPPALGIRSPTNTRSGRSKWRWIGLPRRPGPAGGPPLPLSIRGLAVGTCLAAPATVRHKCRHLVETTASPFREAVARSDTRGSRSENRGCAAGAAHGGIACTRAGGSSWRSHSVARCWLPPTWSGCSWYRWRRKGWSRPSPPGWRRRWRRSWIAFRQSCRSPTRPAVADRLRTTAWRRRSVERAPRADCTRPFAPRANRCCSSSSAPGRRRASRFARRSPCLRTRT